MKGGTRTYLNLKLNYKFSFLKIDSNILKTDSFPFPLNLFFYCNIIYLIVTI